MLAKEKKIIKLKGKVQNQEMQLKLQSEKIIKLSEKIKYMINQRLRESDAFSRDNDDQNCIASLKLELAQSKANLEDS